MKKLVNGQIIEMTPEEIAAMKEAEANQPVSEPTAEERIAALEAAMLEMIMGGTT